MSVEEHAPTQPPTRLGLARAALPWVGLLVSAFFAYLAVRNVRFGDVWDGLTQSDHWWLVPAFLMLALTVVVKAVRWRYLFRREARPPLGPTLSSILIGSFFNAVLPARAGEAARVLALNNRAGTSRAEAASTIVVERSYDVVMLLVLLFVAYPWLPQVTWLHNAAVLAVTLTAALVGVIVVLAIFGSRPLHWMLRPLARLPFATREQLEEIGDKLGHGLAGLRHWRLALGALVWTTVGWLTLAASTWFVMRGFHLGLGFAAAILVVIATNLAMILPSSPSAIGVFEAACLVALRPYGVPDADALSFALVLHALNFIPFIVAGLVVLRGSLTGFARPETVASPPAAPLPDPRRELAPLPARPRPALARERPARPADRGDPAPGARCCSRSASRDRRRRALHDLARRDRAADRAGGDRARGRRASRSRSRGVRPRPRRLGRGRRGRRVPRVRRAGAPLRPARPSRATSRSTTPRRGSASPTACSTTAATLPASRRRRSRPRSTTTGTSTATRSGSSRRSGSATCCSGRTAAWLFQPYLAFLAALLALGLYTVVAPLVESRPLRALAAFVAAQPALLYGYAQWGGVKELGAAAMLALTVALVPTALRDDTRVRSLVPLAVATAAVLGILNVSAGAWLAPLLLPVLVVGIRRRGRAFVWLAAAFAGIVALLSIPSLALARDFYGDVGLNGKGGDIGNLIHPLSWLQIFGIWPAGDFRIRPSNMTATYVLIAASSAPPSLRPSGRGGAAQWLLPLFVGATIVGCAIAVHVGSAWIAAKALAIASPAILLAAMTGAAWLVAGGRRVEGAVLAALICGGVLWSNALAYHDVWLAPRAQLAELSTIGKQFAGDGPTLMTEYQPYGVRHFLRRHGPRGRGRAAPPARSARERPGGDEGRLRGRRPVPARRDPRLPDARARALAGREPAAVRVRPRMERPLLRRSGSARSR